MTRFFQVIIFLGVILTTSYSQTCCSAGAPLNTLLRIDDGSVNTIVLNVGYEYKSINLLIDDGRRLVNDPRTRFGQSGIFKLDYILNDRWAFSTILPLVYQSRNTISVNESSLGFGDLTLFSKYTLINNNIYNVSLVGGLELPTGNTGQISNSQIILSPDMQSGSGTFDFITSLNISKFHVFIPYLTLNFESIYRNNGINNSFGSINNFQGRVFGFGDEINVGLSASYQWIKSSGFYSPDIGVNYRWSNNNIENNVNAPNSGGNWISLPIGISYQANKKTTIRLYSEIPLYQKLEGLQITTNYTGGVQFRYLINSK